MTGKKKATAKTVSYAYDSAGRLTRVADAGDEPMAAYTCNHPRFGATDKLVFPAVGRCPVFCWRQIVTVTLPLIRSNDKMISISGAMQRPPSFPFR